MMLLLCWQGTSLVQQVWLTTKYYITKWIVYPSVMYRIAFVCRDFCKLFMFMAYSFRKLFTFTKDLIYLIYLIQMDAFFSAWFFQWSNCSSACFVPFHVIKVEKFEILNRTKFLEEVIIMVLLPHCFGFHFDNYQILLI